MMGDDMKNLGRMIDIITNHGSRITTSTKRAIGTAGAVHFGCDQAGAFISLYNSPRLSMDDAKTLAADLFTAITYAGWREWLCDHGIAARED